MIYDYIKPKYKDRAKLCHMDTDTFVIHIRTEDFYEDVADDVEKWFDTSNYSKDDNRPLLIGWNEKIICPFNHELGGKIMKELFGLTEKIWACLMNDDSEHKKTKGAKKNVIKRGVMFKTYTDCLFNDKIILKSKQRFESDCHNVYAEQINKIALSSNDDKRL